MSPRQSPSVEQLFQRALELPPEQHGAFLERECAGNSTLRAQLEGLLATHNQALVRHTARAPEADEADATVCVPAVVAEGVGTLIGRYKLLEKLGEGGFGTVWAAEQREPVRRRVALKIIKLGMDTRQVVARFEAERQALALMDHPNIAKVLDAGATDQGRPYFVMELVRGISITRYCAQQDLPVAGRLDLFIHVCHAVQHAHQKGIIHRDIKPSNILVTLHDGVPVPKVIDFGIAKATQQELTAKTLYTHFSQFIGTPAYMSPEQAEMSGLDIDTRTDIYSLGVLLYELLTGSTPFDTEELLRSGLDELRKTIREREPIRPSTRRARDRLNLASGIINPKSEIDADLDCIVMKCLEKDRTRRYATANGLALDIERHLSHEPVSARPPSALYRLSKAFKRNKLAYSAGLAVAVALVTGIGVSTWQAIEARRAQRQAEAARHAELEQRLAAQQAQRLAETESQRADAEARQALESQRAARRLLYISDINLAQQSLRLNNLGRARLLLDRHVPKSDEEDLRGWEWRYLWQLTRGSALATLVHRPTRGFSLAFSPDGTRLAVGWFDGQIDLWDVPGRRWLRTLARGGESQEGQVAFAPAANLLAASTAAGTVTLYDLGTDRESTLWKVSEPEPRMVRDLAFTRDGTRAVIYAGGDDRVGDAVWVVAVSSGQVESRHAAPFGGSYHHGAARLSADGRRLYLARSDALNYQYRIQCLDLANGVELWQTDPQRDFGLTALELSPDERFLVSGSGFEDSAIRVWDPATGRLLFRLDGHTGWVASMAFTDDSQQLVSAASDQSVRVWATSTWTESQVLRGHLDEVHAIAVSTRAQLLASTGRDGNLLLWRADHAGRADGYSSLSLDIPLDGALTLDQSRILLLPSGQMPLWIDLVDTTRARPVPELGRSADVLGMLGTHRICSWDGTNRIQIHESRGSDWVEELAIPIPSGQRPLGLATHAGRQLLAWSVPGLPHSVYLVHLSAPDRRIEFQSDTPQPVPQGFSADGRYLLAGTRDQRFLRVWDVDSGRRIIAIDEPVVANVFAAGDNVLVTTVADRDHHVISFYDLSHAGAAPRRLEYPEFSRALAASPDGRLVAASTYGGLVRLFDPASGTLVGTLHGHLNAVFGIAFSPDGHRLISASGGREAVKLWDVETRQELMTLAGTGSFLPAAAWSSDGNAVLVGQPWQAWHAPPWTQIDTAQPPPTP